MVHYGYYDKSCFSYLFHRNTNRHGDLEQLQGIHLARKHDERERQNHNQEARNSDSIIQRPISSQKYLERSEPLSTEQDYHTSMFNMSQNRYPYARELIESYHQKMSLNLINNKKVQEREEDEEVIVDTDADVSMVGMYDNQRESPCETSNVPEDLSKNSRKRNCSSENSENHHSYTTEKKLKVEGRCSKTPPPNEQEARQSPTPTNNTL